jgi:hypothetical protein
MGHRVGNGIRIGLPGAHRSRCRLAVDGKAGSCLSGPPARSRGSMSPRHRQDGYQSVRAVDDQADDAPTRAGSAAPGLTARGPVAAAGEVISSNTPWGLGQDQRPGRTPAPDRAPLNPSTGRPRRPCGKVRWPAASCLRWQERHMVRRLASTSSPPLARLTTWVALRTAAPPTCGRGRRTSGSGTRHARRSPPGGVADRRSRSTACATGGRPRPISPAGATGAPYRMRSR